MFRYRLHSPDGDDLGEAAYAMTIKPGEEIHGNGGQRAAGARCDITPPFQGPDDAAEAISGSGEGTLAQASACRF